jgi:hypothetical protein
MRLLTSQREDFLSVLQEQSKNSDLAFSPYEMGALEM